jgi:predicted GIY-YIG superfamily endonuclease
VTSIYKLPVDLYRLYDADGALLYVGVSVNPVARLIHHKRAKDWYHDIAKIVIEKHATREAAYAAERKAIREENPKHNMARLTKIDRDKEAAIEALWRDTSLCVDDAIREICTINSVPLTHGYLHYAFGGRREQANKVNSVPLDRHNLYDAFGPRGLRR